MGRLSFWAGSATSLEWTWREQPNAAMQTRVRTSSQSALEAPGLSFSYDCVARACQSKRLVIEARWVSTPLAFADKLRPRRPNSWPFGLTCTPLPGLASSSHASACDSPKHSDSANDQPSCIARERRCRQPMATRQRNGRSSLPSRFRPQYFLIRTGVT
jgi:hypothetical protein